MPIVKISLKAARVNANLKLIDAAKAIGVGKDTLIKWERHPGLVAPVWQAQISKIYNMPIEAIFFGI